MNYILTVTIKDPNTKPGMYSGLTLELECNFIVNPETYGNKTYLSIHSPKTHEFDNHYDIRYDTNYYKEQQIQYLIDWAFNYWSGKNGSWEIQAISVEKI